MTDQISKHPNYNNELLPENNDLFKPDFKRDSRGRYFMQLPGYGKWMVGNEPGSKIITQGSEDEAGGPATDVGSLHTGSLSVDTVIKIGDSIYLDGGNGCIYVGDYDKRIGAWIGICGNGLYGYNGNDLNFGYFLEDNGSFGKGDVLIGDAGSSNYVWWDDSAGVLIVEGNITATSGYIGGWEIDYCLKSQYVISAPAEAKIELCPGNPGHVQVAYSPTGVFSIPGDVYMVQMTQGSTGDPGGIPIPRVDVYRAGVKRAMLNSDGLFFFEADGTTIATAIYSGAIDEAFMTNINATGGDLAGAIQLNNAQTINSVTSHVITTGNAHSADLTDINDAQNYMSRIDATIEDALVPTYIGYIWTSKLVATLPGAAGVVLNSSGLRGYDNSGNLRFLLNSNTGDFYFGNYPSGNYVSWLTSGGQLVVKGEIRALSGYIGGNTSGWKIDTNVIQAFSGATKVIELSSAGPHIQCLLNSSNYVQMTPASSDPRFDVFSGGIRRARLNGSGLTFWDSGETTVSSFDFTSNTLKFYSSGVERASLRGAVKTYGGIYCSGDLYIPNNRSFWIQGTGSQYGGMGLTSGNSLWMTCGSANTFYVFNTAQSSQMFGVSTSAVVVGGPSYTGMDLIPYSSGVATLGDSTHRWDDVWCNTVGRQSGNAIWFDQSGRVQVDNHFDPSGAGTKNCGGPSRYWNYITCNDITKIAGDGAGWLWLDDGVELNDGRKVSDVEAINLMEAEDQIDKKGRKVRVIKKQSLPKILLRKAKNHEGIPFDRDENDEPYELDEEGNKIPLYDGESVFGMISLLIGCVKELDAKIKQMKKNK